jgi:hypothetical protein
LWSVDGRHAAFDLAQEWIRGQFPEAQHTDANNFSSIIDLFDAESKGSK